MEIIITILAVVVLYLWWRINGLASAVTILSKSLMDMAGQADRELDEIKIRIEDIESNSSDDENEYS